jgi:hypothetical protein
MKKLLLSIIISLFLCTGVYAGPWISGGSSAGGGTVDVSGTPANHYWTGWTDADTIKGFSITASKPVCSDANGDPAVCAGTEGVWQVANADLATLAAGGSANCLWGEKSDSSGIECKSTINVQIDDSAAQFYNATNTTRKIKADASGITADSKTYTIKPIADVDVTFSPGKTYTDGKWCTYATATGLTCNQAAPAGTGDILADGSVAFTGAPIPSAANTVALGSVTAEWADIYLGDGAVINLGNDQDVTITHVADTGVLLNSTRQMQFGDSGTYINQSADGTINIVSDTIAQIVAPNIKLAIDDAAYLNVAVANAGGATLSVVSDGVDTITIGDGTDDQVRTILFKSATNEHYAGTVMKFTCHETIAFGQPVVINSDGEVALANADTPATLLPAIGLAVVGGNAADTCTVLTHGSATDTDWNWTPGATIYVDDSGAGVLTATVGDITTGNGVQVIGIATHADSILVMPSLSVVVLE